MLLNRGMTVPTNPASGAITYADEDGQHSVALDSDSISLGRAPTQTIILRDPSVSRQHAVIVREGDGFTVVDQGSTHGTFVNGVRVSRAALNSGDVLQLGSLNGPRLIFRIHSSSSFPADLISSFEGFALATKVFATGERPMEQLNWLLSAARRLNQSGVIEDTLDALLQMTLQLTGLERGFVFVRDAGGDGGEMRMAQGLHAGVIITVEDDTVSRRAIRRAVESGRRFSVSDTLADEQASGWSSILVHGIRSIYCIPLRKPAKSGNDTELLGLLYLDSLVGPGHLTEVDHQLLETIATEAAALLHNALLAEAEFKARKDREELVVAARIHSGLMSITLPTLDYVALEARSVPCLAIGGDFFDAVALDDCLCVAIADVSGKGVSAAIVAATLQGILHAQFLARQSLVSIAGLVNQFLCARNVGKYATMVMMKVFADGRMEYINCGHIQPLAICGGEVRRLTVSNLVVGLIEEATYVSGWEMLRPGERVLLATDGVTEAEDKDGEPFGDHGLTAIAAQDDLEELLQRVIAFQAPNDATDDCTMLQVRYRG